MTLVALRGERFPPVSTSVRVRCGFYSFFFYTAELDDWVFTAGGPCASVPLLWHRAAIVLLSPSITSSKAWPCWGGRGPITRLITQAWLLLSGVVPGHLSLLLSGHSREDGESGKGRTWGEPKIPAPVAVFVGRWARAEPGGIQRSHFKKWASWAGNWKRSQNFWMEAKHPPFPGPSLILDKQLRSASP